MSSLQLAKYYDDHVRLAQGSEPVTIGFIESANAVYANVLSKPLILKLLQDSNDEWGNEAPPNSISKLQAVAAIVKKDDDMLAWIIGKVHDDIKSEQHDKGAFSLKFLKNCLGGQKGYLDLAIMKKDLAKHCLYADLPSRCKDATIVTKVVNCLKDLKSYRANLQPLKCDADQANDIDMTWKASLPQSVKQALTLYEQLVYENTFDTQLKCCVRAGKTASECMTHGTIGEVMAEIQQAEAQEKGKTDPVPLLQQSATPSNDQMTQSKDTAIDALPIVPSLDDPTDKPAVDAWYKQRASKKVLEVVKFIYDPGTLNKLVEALRNTTAQNLEGNIRGHILIHLDVNLTGESKTAPHVRTVPFRKDVVSRLVTAILTVRAKDPSNPCSIGPGDVFVYLDGGKHGSMEYVNRLFVKSKGRYEQVCKAEKLSKSKINVHFDEKSIKERTCRQKSFFCEHQPAPGHACVQT